jgi:predicted AAA+ superfamily ATPase
MKRILNIDISENNAFFLWGARKTGKTTYLKNKFKEVLSLDIFLNILF